MTGRPTPLLPTTLAVAADRTVAGAAIPRFAGARTILALMVREMGTTYGRSPGGYAWAILDTLGMIAIMALAFSLLTRTPALGTSFFLFYATGWLSYGFYTEIEMKTRRALRYSSALLSYPRVSWIDTVLARVILATLTEMTTMVIIFAGVLMFVDDQVTLNIPPILTALALAFCLGLGVGLVDCLLSGLFQLWAVLWGMVTRPLMLMSAVLFIYEDMPPVIQHIIWWNPLTHVTGLFRTGFYATYDAAFVSLTYAFAVALTLVAFGLLMMRAWYKLVLEV